MNIGSELMKRTRRVRNGRRKPNPIKAAAMRYLALATDYDNTLAANGRVAGATRAALGRLRASGRRAILVTGRRLDDLLRVCECSDLFDYVVAENGAVLYEPQGRDITLLAEPPSEQFVAALRRRGVQPLEVGKVIVATHAPQETRVIETIRELGLELQVIFNREAVMVLPAGINKASGTKLALRNLGMSPHEAGRDRRRGERSFLHAPRRVSGRSRERGRFDQGDGGIRDGGRGG